MRLQHAICHVVDVERIEEPLRKTLAQSEIEKLMVCNPLGRKEEVRGGDVGRVIGKIKEAGLTEEERSAMAAIFEGAAKRKQWNKLKTESKQSEASL